MSLSARTGKAGDEASVGRPARRPHPLGSRQRRDMIRSQVHDIDGFRDGRVSIRAAESKRGPVWRPGRVKVTVLSALSVGHAPNRAAVKGHYVDPSGIARPRRQFVSRRETSEAAAARGGR